MTTFNTLLGGIWAVFLTFWVVSAFGAKRTVKGTLARGAVFRLAFAVAFIFMIQVWFRFFGRQYATYAPAHVNPIEASFGVAVCATGVAIAIWARVYLGRNWGMPMSLREGHELVTTGPYSLVRHPIYTGILIAVIGTILVKVFPGIVLLPVLVVYFVYAAVTEERSMKQQFPNEYPEYMKRTKMLIPYVL